MQYSQIWKMKPRWLKDLLGHSPLINLFFKTITKKITDVQYHQQLAGHAELVADGTAAGVGSPHQRLVLQQKLISASSKSKRGKINSKQTLVWPFP